MILNKLIKSRGKCHSKSKTYLFFCYPSQAESNTLPKYEYEYTLCVIYKTQTGFCK